MHLYHSMVFLGLLRFVLLLEVTPDSVCGSLCDAKIANGADSSDSQITTTSSSDLVCNDYEYDGSNATEVGHRFKDCLSCELSSTATDAKSNENDVYWALFHMKYTVAWCLFAFPENINITLANNQCADICSGPDNFMKPALVDRLLNTDLNSQYSYCTDKDGAFSKSTDACKQCLRAVPNVEVLINFLDALKLACDQRPNPENLLKLDFDVFPSMSTSVMDSGSSSSESLSSKSSAASNSSVAILSAGNWTTTTSRKASSETPSAARSPPLYPGPSSSGPTISGPTVSSTAASASHDNVVRIGVGVGVGLGGTAALSVAAGILVWWWRQYDVKLKNKAHDRRKKAYRIHRLLDLQHQDLQHQDLHHQDMQHQALQHQDVQHQDPQHQDLQHQDQQYRDLKHQDLQHQDPQHQDPQHQDPQHQDPQHQDPQHQDPQPQDPKRRDLQNQDSRNDHSVPELQASDFVTGAAVMPRATRLRLSDPFTEYVNTSRTTQLREPYFVIEAEVMPPMRE